ncbi:uncharacterized protein [Littorina saxatilis]|uniref:uncharacterized protein n=1 Tax=Littorina saxatilis TaxID=31220 RepID=UPI0038B55FF5
MQQIPPIPANFEEVLIEGVWATTQRESRFLLEQDNFWQYRHGSQPCSSRTSNKLFEPLFTQSSSRLKSGAVTSRQERLAGPGFLRRLGRHWQDVQDLIKKVLALAFLPVALVRQNFQTLFTDPLTANLARQVAGLQVFLAYFRRNYIIPGNVAQPAEWNVYRRDVDTRSNNHVEAWNRRWNATVGRRHPNFWYFLTRVRQEEVLSRGAINAVARGEAPPARRLKYRRMETRIQRLKAEYHSGRRSLYRYWSACAHLVLH